MNLSLKKYLPFYKRNLKVAFPVMITQAGQVVVQLADNIMVGKASVHMGIFYMSLCGLLFILLRNILPYIYTSDTEVIAFASKIIVVLSLYQISDAIQLTSIASLRGLKDTKIPMYFAIFSYYIVAIPAAYLLGFVFDLGPEGVWCGLLLGLSVAAVLAYTRFCKLCRKAIDAARMN